MSNPDLKYQIRMDSAQAEAALRSTQAQLKNTGAAVYALSRGASAFSLVSSGFRDALRGNVSGLVSMAYGIGLAMSYLVRLNPLVAAISILLAAAGAAQMIFSRRTKQAAEAAEEARRAVNALGLSMSDLDRHQQGVRDAADSFDRIERSATNAAAAIQRMYDAQLNFNRAASQATLARIDHEEAVALADPSLTPEERRGIERNAAQQRAEEQRAVLEREQEIKDRSFQSSIAELDRQRESDQSYLAMLDNNIKQAESQFQSLRDSIAADIAGEQLDLGEIRRRREDGSMTFQESHDMLLRRNQSERFAAVWRSSPGRALALPYATEHLTDERKNEISGFSRAVTSARRDREAFQADMPYREEERLNRRSELEADRRRHAEERSTAETRIDTGLVTLDSRHAAERMAEQEQEDAEEKAEQKAVDQANSTAGQAERRYRFDQIDPEAQLQIVTKAIERTRARIASTDGLAQASARQTLVQQLRERDAISSRIEANAPPDLTAIAADYRRQLAELRPISQDVGILDRFDWKRAVGEGRTPDEMMVEEARRMRELLEKIAQAEGVK